MSEARLTIVVAVASLCLGLVVATTGGVAQSIWAAPSAEGAAPSAELPRRTAIRFLTESDFPPFHYLDDEGVLTGFDIDIARAICLELAAACDVQARPRDELVPALLKGETDAVIASHVVSPTLLAQVDFTDRYYYTPAWFAGRRESPRLEPTPEGLAGQKIGVVTGGPHEAYLRTFFRESTVVGFDSAELARDALSNRSLDLVFDDGISLGFWLNGTRSRECCEFKGGPYMEAKFFGDGIAAMVAKRDPQLKGLINQALRRVRDSGRYEELLLRYFPNRLY